MSWSSSEALARRHVKPGCDPMIDLETAQSCTDQCSRKVGVVPRNNRPGSKTGDPALESTQQPEDLLPC
jgi:hypothetical protein